MLNTLNVSQTGLNSAKIAVENVSNNIANENTPGYKKRVVDIREMEQTDSRFTGRGVQSPDAYRITNEYMFDRLLEESTKENGHMKLTSILGSVETAFKETDNSGFSSDLNRYFQAVENLRSNPNSEVYKNALINEGKILVSSLQNLYEGIEKAQEVEKRELYGNVDKVNEILGEIGEINEKLGKQSEATNDLLDRRDYLEETLSAYVDIEVDRSFGEYSLSIAGNVAVRYDTNVRDVSVIEVNTAQIDRFADDNGTGSSLNFIDNTTGLPHAGTPADPNEPETGDKITYKLNNYREVTVEIGTSTYTDSHGNTHNIDLDGDNVADTVDASNYVRALAFAINADPDMKGLVTAYNGNYKVNDDGTKESSITGSDRFLLVESDLEGADHDFESRIVVTENVAGVETRNNFYRDEGQSKDSETRVAVSIYDKEITLSSGALKVQTENISSGSESNKLEVYKNKLDAFANTLADVTDKYIRTGVDEYMFGEKAIDQTDANTGTIVDIGLFTGTDVKSLTFNESAVNDLDQKDLDYLAELQWKKDISFTEKAQDSTDADVTSFSEFFQEIRAIVSTDKESADFVLDTQKDIKAALTSTYEQLVKVDKDEEMINLVKFQSAYTANAKIITIIDEMLQTLLGLKR